MELNRFMYKNSILNDEIWIKTDLQNITFFTKGYSLCNGTKEGPFLTYIKKLIEKKR